MTTLDTLALQRSDMMLRDQHYRFNTTSLKHRKLSPYQQRVISVVITSFEAILLRHSSLFFHDVGTALASSGCDLRSCSHRAALARWRGERYQ
jgi:hypothetical protein